MMITTTSGGQGRAGDRSSEGSPLANPRADEQESHRRPIVRVRWPSAPKPTEGGRAVNAAVAGRKIVFLPREVCRVCAVVSPGAPLSAMAAGRRQESAEGIVVEWHS